ncbi:hypothetical protein R5M92_10950 [Halomonas sp. Bachu 37]|uniref:hypothetical protein n=1 Tax=Halomonas kashgarensis TaxID=3084920 RepID=UPI0032166381
MRTVALFTLFFSLPVVAAENDWLFGSWKITDVRFPGITAMTEQEADEWIGHTIHYNEDSASRNGQVCTDPTYTMDTISAHDFASMNRVSFEMLALTVQKWMWPTFPALQDGKGLEPA